MGNAYSGRNMFIGVGIQSALGTDATIFDYIQPTEVGGFLKSAETIQSNRRLGTRFGGSGYPGASQVPWNFTCELNPKNIGRILAGAIGADDITVDVVDEVATHSFEFDEALSYLTLYCYGAGVADATGSDKVLKVTDAKITGLTIRGNTDDVMLLEVSGIGIAVEADTTPTPSYPTENPFFLNTEVSVGTVVIGDTIGGGAQFDEATEISVELDNGMAPDHRINGSAEALGIREGASALRGSLSCVYNDDTFVEINKFYAGTARGIKITVAHASEFYTSHSMTLTIELDAVKYEGSDPSWDPDVISISMPFVADVSSSTKITLKNDKVTVYSAAA